MTLKRRIRQIMDDTAQDMTAGSSFLYLLSKCYGWGGAVRNFFYDRHIMPVKKLPCRVICVGNLCVGGTGKTPVTMYTAELLRELGYRGCIISRGYKGSVEHSGGIVADGKTVLMDAADAGDEPYMMATRLGDIPVIVGKDRYGAGLKAVSAFNPHVVLLDDGFQHRRLYRDVDLVLLDHEHPVGNGYLLPRGRLREAVAGLSRSHGIIYTRSPEGGKKNIPDTIRDFDDGRLKIPVFYSSHKPRLVAFLQKNGNNRQKVSGDKDGDGFIRLKEKRVYAFSGIARNADFKNTIEGLGARVTGHKSFDDHHGYTENEIHDIINNARTSGADMIVTTEKDDARLPRSMGWPLDYAVIGVDISFGEDAAAFRKFLVDRLGGITPA